MVFTRLDVVTNKNGENSNKSRGCWSMASQSNELGHLPAIGELILSSLSWEQLELQVELQPHGGRPVPPDQ